MSSVPSFERLNYMLRTNKHIERKLVFDLLTMVYHKLSIPDLWYLGFGSMWFSDFKLAHRQLSINDMVSIERDAHADRAIFNSPLASIQVKPGDSNAVLPALLAEKSNRSVVAWLDYDGVLNNTVVSDLNILLNQVAVNSVIVFTVNAEYLSYKSRAIVLNQRTRRQTAVGWVEELLGTAAVGAQYQPRVLPNGGFTDSVKKQNFPEFFAEAIQTYMKHYVTNQARMHEGVDITYVPLYKLHHVDGADMITVGGVVTTVKFSQIWKGDLQKIKLLSEGGLEPIYQKLDLIPVTIKEKITIDSCIPDEVSKANYVANVRAKGVKLSDEELSKYLKFYQHFPVFVETLI